MLSNSPLRVLLVDDEPHIITAVEFLLEREKCLVAKAYNGHQALEKAADFTPDVIVLDVMMPGLDGFAVARQIRNNPQYSDTNIIFLTAKGTDNDRWQGYASGAESYITKPFDNQNLVDTVMEMAMMARA